MFCLVLGVGSSFAQLADKRETDAEGRELKGKIRSVKIVTEVIEAADKNKTSDGWIPSEITFDKFGNIERAVQFGSDGSVENTSVAEIDKNGNKLKEIFCNAVGELRFTHVFDYDERGNLVEFKRIEPDGEITGLSRFDFDKQGRNESNISYNTNGTVNMMTEIMYNKFGERVGETSSIPEHGVITSVEYKRSKDNGVETVETVIRGVDGTITAKYIDRTDHDGNESTLSYSPDGTLEEKQTWEYPQKDQNGNWTVEIMTKWEPKDGDLVIKLKKKTIRTIKYY